LATELATARRRAGWREFACAGQAVLESEWMMARQACLCHHPKRIGKAVYTVVDGAGWEKV